MISSAGTPDAADVVDTVDVVAVMVTYNSAAHLPQVLAALPDAFADVPSWRLAVVDNDSHDGSVELVKTLAPTSVRVQLGRNLGYAAGLNAGMRAVRARQGYLVLNPDVTPAPGCVARMLPHLADRSVGVVVPNQRDPHGQLLYSLRRNPTVLRALGDAVLGGHRAGRVALLGETVVQRDAYDKAMTVDWASGSMMLVSAECWAELDGWDESYFLYSEETDFALRARDHGWTVLYCPEAESVHVGGDSHVSPTLYSLLTLNRIKLYRRRHGAVATWAFAGAVALNELLRSGRVVHRQALRALCVPSERRRVPGWRS